MSLVGRIETAAKGKGLTFKALEREIGLGNGTIKRWEVQSPRLDKLVMVADYLHISLDELVYGRSETATASDGVNSVDFEGLRREQGLMCDGSPLSEDEADLVAMYRLLPSHEREDLFDLVYFKYRKHVEKKAESIYWTYFDGDKKSGSPGGADAREGTA